MDKKRGRKKAIKKRKKKINKERGQTLPVVLIIGAVLSIFATYMVSLYHDNVKFLGFHQCIIAKQELATIGMEHALYRLQQGSTWNVIPSTMLNYSHEFSTDLGNYAIHIVKGNLFMTDPTDDATRQARTGYRTIGIKVKTKNTGCKGMYYAVIQKMGYGGPLISKGKIDLNCNDNDAEDYAFYWGDVYSANTNTAYCRIPLIPVGNGNVHPQPWAPQVYAAGPIYTAVDATGSRGGGASYTFAYVYDDMSPTAHSHPYSEYAKAAEIDLDYYKMLAMRNNAYYGPPNIGGGGANPYYINDGNHDISDVNNSNNVDIMAKLNGINAALFIDTTDALPLRESPCNSYTGRLDLTANDGSDGTLKFYVDNDNQYMTTGLCFVQGPLLLIGDDPSDISNTHGYTWTHGAGGSGSGVDRVYNVWPPDNYYFPQNDSDHYDKKGNQAASYIDNVKHYGILYTGGELHIGGAKAGCPSGRFGGGCNDSDICIFGTVYLGEYGSLKVENSSDDDPKLYVYYNQDVNVFGFTGASVMVTSFNELTFLMPTPTPRYPASFSN